MVPQLTASRARARTSIAFATAGATILVALLLHPRARTAQAPTPDQSDDGMRISARLTSTEIQAGRDHNLAVTIVAPGGGSQLRPPLSVSIVIDRSASMSGETLAHATTAAAKL